MIYYPKIFGTCAGANKAIKLALELKDKFNNKNIYIYKEILHNPYIINELKKKNIYCIDTLDNVTKDDILVIRAHGETKSTFDYLNKHNITYFDATCINVKRVHELVEQKYLNHENIIIVGKKNILRLCNNLGSNEFYINHQNKGNKVINKELNKDDEKNNNSFIFKNNNNDASQIIFIKYEFY